MRVFAGTIVFAALVAGLSVVPACAPTTVSLPIVSTPHYPDFLKPTVPPELISDRAAVNQERAWVFFQGSDLKNADREALGALKATPTFYPADVMVGYVALAREDAAAALTHFDAALTLNPAYVPALAGKGQALEALGKDDDAVSAWSAALAADRSLSDAQRRIDVLRFRSVQRDVAAARQAARSGRPGEALRAYRTAIERSPDTAFLYRELGVIEREGGDTETALADFRKAVALDSTDTASLRQVAELLEQRGDFQAALEVYDGLLALEPDAALEARRNAVKTRAETASLPEAYRALETAAEITRGDLAALVGVRLASLVQLGRARDVGVMTDVRGHWAETWILSVAGAGVLDPFADHTFQPRTVVLRADLAEAVTRLLAKVAIVAPAQARGWINARGRFADVGTSHVAYLAVSAAAASGVMRPDGDGLFLPARPVTGAEVVEALDRVRALAPIGSPVERR